MDVEEIEFPADDVGEMNDDNFNDDDSAFNKKLEQHLRNDDDVDSQFGDDVDQDFAEELMIVKEKIVNPSLTETDEDYIHFAEDPEKAALRNQQKTNASNASKNSSRSRRDLSTLQRPSRYERACKSAAQKYDGESSLDSSLSATSSEMSNVAKYYGHHKASSLPKAIAPFLKDFAAEVNEIPQAREKDRKMNFVKESSSLTPQLFNIAVKETERKKLGG